MMKGPQFMDNHSMMQHGSAPSVWLYITVVLLVAAIGLYLYASRVDQRNSSKLKKDEKAALKKKHKSLKLAAHTVLVLTFISGAVELINITAGPDIELLNFDVPIEVTEDMYYGSEHSDDPVQYEMSIPTSGMHSPHDLKFGFYAEKPSNEMLVHNLEHGDIIIYYRPDADETVLKEMKYWAEFTKQGSGVLTVPNDNIPSNAELVVTAWTKTMVLQDRSEKQIGTFIYRYINQGPETIPPNIRQGGGTM
jgi:hypothetical protein